MKKVLAAVLVVLVSGVAAADGKRVRQVRGIDQAQLPADARININQFMDPRVTNRNAANRQGTAIHEPFTGPMTARKVQIAVADAVAYLRARQNADGSMGNGGGVHRVGSTALGALAMLAAGVDPASDPGLRRALDWLTKQDVNHTYCRGIRANVWEYALRKVPYDKNIRAALKRDFDWLMGALKHNGRAWRYNASSRDWDNSCSQYGVLGIWAAARAGFDPGDEFWKKMSTHFRSSQRPDGGWSYTTGGSTANMVTAGLASMFLVFDMHHGKSFYSADNPRAFTEGDASACLRSIERGMAWLGKSNSGQKETGYYLYGIERTAVAGGRKYFGGEDWFKRGALALLKRQDGRGGLNVGRWGDDVARTGWCTLFLVYGGAPVAFNKLEYGDGQDWNLNPRDLANLAKHLWSAYERPLNWQTVSIQAPAAEIEAPVLFLSGSKAAKFGEKEVLKLREYVERGGTILAEPSDHSTAFADSMRDLVRQMFPVDLYPAYKLAPLPEDHGIYTVMKQAWQKRPELLGVSDGSRTFFVLSKEYMSADWQMNKTESDAFKLAMNLLFYATDLATLEGRFASILPATAPAKERNTVATVARVKHAGAEEGPRDWEAGSRCWETFAPYVRHVTGCKLEAKPAVDLAADELKGIGVLHITGRRALRLSAKEKDALRKYVQGGGTVLVDAYAGSVAFAESARKEIEDLFGKLEPLADDSILASGRCQGGADLTRGIRYKLPARRRLRDAGKSSRKHQLEVVTVKRRPAVIFSAMDLTAGLGGVPSYQSVGYKPESARKIAGNLFAYVMAD